MLGYSLFLGCCILVGKNNNCTNIKSTYNSLASILGETFTDVGDFVELNTSRISFDEKDGYSIFIRPKIKD